jgi:ribosome-binding factor A
VQNRPARVGDQIREELSGLLRREVQDPGIGFTTITWVKVSPDLQVARVYYTVLGDARARKEAARALHRAAAFLRRQVALRLRLRRAPELAFEYDESVHRGERIEQLIQEIHAARAAAADGPEPPGAAAADQPDGAPRDVAAGDGPDAGETAGEGGDPRRR